MSVDSFQVVIFSICLDALHTTTILLHIIIIELLKILLIYISEILISLVQCEAIVDLPILHFRYSLKITQ